MITYTYIITSIYLFLFAICFSEEDYIVEFINTEGKKTICKHHPDGRLYAVENYQIHSSDSYVLQTRDHFLWDQTAVTSSFQENPNGEILSCSNYDYDTSGKIEREFQSIYSSGEITESTTYTYTQEGCLITNPSSLWDHFSSFASWCADTISSIVDELDTLRETFSYSNYIRGDIEPLFEEVMGKGFLQFAGYYQQEDRTGIYKGESPRGNSKVRVTMINGILSLHDDLEKSMEDISKSHGNSDIHYVFRATEGWTKDILNGVSVKFGHISEQAYMLAGLWSKLIEELGGVDSSGTIIHYAHSVGALETYRAQFLLTPEQRRMIHVVTIGSPAMIPNEGFASVVNYASRRDGVCLLDPINYIGGMFHEGHNNVYIDTFSGGYPMVDHPLSVDSYQNLIKELGQKFVDTYGMK